MKVKILKCSKSTYWYNDEIGNTYDVNIDPEDNQTYIVSDLEPTHYLGISDCEILSVPQHETPKVGTNKKAKEVYCGIRAMECTYDNAGKCVKNEFCRSQQ